MKRYKATIRATRSFSKGRLKGGVKLYFTGAKTSVIIAKYAYDAFLKKLGISSLRGKEVHLLVECEECGRYFCPCLMEMGGKYVHLPVPNCHPTTGDTNG